jgi:hypothetical protein
MPIQGPREFKRYTFATKSMDEAGVKFGDENSGWECPDR